ncbi:MAG: PKD domain-containing protein [Cytophagales bacterium]|nr:MAG: PKD domain-containing protein [Cytophagales bacterium]
MSCDGNINFTDNSLNSPTKWLWEFGDGGTSTDKNPKHQYTKNGIYTIKLKVSNTLGEDVLIKTEAMKVNILPIPVSQDVSRCGSGEVILKTNNTSNDYIAQWFDSETGGKLLATGNTYTTTINNNTTFFVENSTIKKSFKVGPVDNSFSSGSNFNNNDLRGLVFDVFTFIQLKSVKVYATGAANREIQLLDTIGGNVLATKIINIPDGESRVNLNFDIAPGKHYYLKVKGTVNLFRNATGGANYPYVLNDVLSIIESDVVTTNPRAYYFFYDWEVELKGCSTSRLAVKAINDCNSIDNRQGMNSFFSINYMKDEKSIKIIAKEDNERLLNLELIDIVGRVHSNESIQINSRGSQYLIPTANLYHGVYFMRLSDDKYKSYTHKLSIE